MSRRPSVSIYNYPESLNPFNDDTTTTTISTIPNRPNGETKTSVKEGKTKFWTFGRSKKKQRSNSFSIKSTWSGLFGKRKDAQEVEIRKPTIATVSSTYKRETYDGYPVAAARVTSDQREFDEALGTLARRRKYTLDNNSSRYGSSLTVNGDPGRIYEGTPQDTTASIMGDLTPKPPARRFGQVSPKPTDKIPPLDFGKERSSNGNAIYEGNGPDGTPLAPKRGGRRASQRSIAASPFSDDDNTRSGDVSLRDENENVPDDYVFKRFNRDVTRQSNLSINSCASVGSTMSAYGRKKRRAPQPPRSREPLESPKEIDVRPPEIVDPNVELQIVEPIDITKVTENIDEMTKRNLESIENDDSNDLAISKNEKIDEQSTSQKNHPISSTSNETVHDVIIESSPSTISTDRRRSTEEIEESPKKSFENEKSAEKNSNDVESIVVDDETSTHDVVHDSSIVSLPIDETIEVELRKKSNDQIIETIKDAKSIDEESAPLSSHESSGNLSRDENFSVKDVIDNIERKIKYLEAKKARDDVDKEESPVIFERCGSRRSLRETRKNFFLNMVDDDAVKVEMKELPRLQNDIKIVRIEDTPIVVDSETESVKIIELHITEPIRRTSTIVNDRDVNPIPKPRRHSNLGIDSKDTKIDDKDGDDENEKRTNSF